MGQGDFGGDRSVQWLVRGEHVRQVAGGPELPNGHRHEGIDETDDNEDQAFTVVVRRPQTGWPAGLLTALQNFLRAPGATLEFSLPVEDRNYLFRHGMLPPNPAPRQITVKWPSRGGA